MQIKTTVRYHFTPTDIIKKWKITIVGEDMEKMEPLYISFLKIYFIEV